MTNAGDGLWIRHCTGIEKVGRWGQCHLGPASIGKIYFIIANKSVELAMFSHRAEIISRVNLN